MGVVMANRRLGNFISNEYQESLQQIPNLAFGRAAVSNPANTYTCG